MNVLWQLVEFAEENIASVRESHTVPGGGIEPPEVAREVIEIEAAVELARAALQALGVRK